jgi:YfiH family protein
MARDDTGAVSTSLGIGAGWAISKQVHGGDVVEVTGPGTAGKADAMLTASRNLPLAVFTADCAGVVLESAGGVAVVHAGWRGAAVRVVANAARRLGERDAARGKVIRAALGPVIGPCCFEVGEEVSALFPGWESTTTWGTASVDLGAAVRSQVSGASWWSLGACTRCEDGWFSYRGSGANSRQAAIGWIP